MDALSARVLVSKPVEGDYRIHWLVVERGDPSSDTFERLEVPIDVGIVSRETASVGTMEYRAWKDGHHVGRVPQDIRERALLLIFWIFWRRGTGLSLEEDRDINTVPAGELLRAAMAQIRRNNGDSIRKKVKPATLKTEMAKCDVVCVLCHRYRTHGQKRSLGVA